MRGLRSAMCWSPGLNIPWDEAPGVKPSGVPGEGAWSLLLLSSPHGFIEALGLMGFFEHYSLIG